MKSRLLVLCSTLITWAVAVSGAKEAPACRTYSSKGQLVPASGALRDPIFVGDAFAPVEASVLLDLSHRRVGSLQVRLSAQSFSDYQAGKAPEGSSIVLKSQGMGRMGHDLFQTNFTDASPNAFPLAGDAAPFTGTYRPTQRMGFLLSGASATAGQGGSQGVWVLDIQDLAPNPEKRLIFLNGWTLRLCEEPLAEPEPSPSPSPVQPSPSPSPEPSSSPAEPSPPPLPSPQPSPAVPPVVPVPVPTPPLPSPSPAARKRAGLLSFFGLPAVMRAQPSLQQPAAQQPAAQQPAAQQPPPVSAFSGPSEQEEPRVAAFSWSSEDVPQPATNAFPGLLPAVKAFDGPSEQQQWQQQDARVTAFSWSSEDVPQPTVQAFSGVLKSAPAAPGVTAFSGPAEEDQGTAPAGATSAGARPRQQATWFGLPIMYKTQQQAQPGQQAAAVQEQVQRVVVPPTTPSAPTRVAPTPPPAKATPATGTGAAAAAGAAATTPLLGSKVLAVLASKARLGAGAQAPLLTTGSLQQGVQAWVKQKFGTLCADPQCTNVRQGMWKLVIAGLYAHAFAQGAESMQQDTIHLYTRLQQLLPGDNPALASAVEWMSSHQTQLEKLGANVVRMMEDNGVPLPEPLAGLLTATRSADGQAASVEGLLGPLAKAFMGDGDLSNNALPQALMSALSPLMNRGAGAGGPLAGLLGDGNPGNNAMPQALWAALAPLMDGGDSGAGELARMMMGGSGDPTGLTLLAKAVMGELGPGDVAGANSDLAQLAAQFGGLGAGASMVGAGGATEAPAPSPLEELFSSPEMQDTFASFLAPAGGANMGSVMQSMFGSFLDPLGDLGVGGGSSPDDASMQELLSGLLGGDMDMAAMGLM